MLPEMIEASLPDLINPTVFNSERMGTDDMLDAIRAFIEALEIKSDELKLEIQRQLGEPDDSGDGQCRLVARTVKAGLDYSGMSGPLAAFNLGYLNRL